MKSFQWFGNNMAWEETCLSKMKWIASFTCLGVDIFALWQVDGVEVFWYQRLCIAFFFVRVFSGFMEISRENRREK